MATKFKINGKYQYGVFGILGEDSARIYKYKYGKLTKQDRKDISNNGWEMFRYFNTKAEADAYLLGVFDGVGSYDFAETTMKEYEKIWGPLPKTSKKQRSFLNSDDRQ